MTEKFSSCAKINLFLYITSKRGDGYHTLYSLMTPIDLCDDLYLDFETDKIKVTCNHPDVPEDESNLAHKAAVLFYDALKEKGYEKRGIGIEIIKQIPPGGGLGGGSSNAATVLTALNTHHRHLFSKSELMHMGLRLGADVPFFIFGSPAIVQGIGEKLEKAPDLMRYHLVLCDPGVAAATAAVYKKYDFELTSNQKYTKNAGLNVLLRGRKFDAGNCAHNDLEGPACRLYPEIRETKEEMELLLHTKVRMTGSGSSLFALFQARKDAEKGCEILLGKWAGSKRKPFLSSFG
ncbi:MAG: 4-(cytidine 5'-diphospho)-2-C-methyl-D-erythritol kinase [Desulfobacterales bacterium RIFOXYA12_FULL_46_15]|nr:MAG: 4-(cytidine 5'-diphospho)-2-C-methyl-D-erythritol kinase [Desulfobacula sp. GWF2_41_7]OGR24875.1 MAG: 4-(cytidine 5'-diphospho)-2-C-methyl-D-erythritol kinase [Desulfobacterales bacterium RIFOXYA12_FULL_46_15]